MSRDESQGPSTGAIAIAASAVTIAVGVTIGALTGYIRPPAEAETAQSSEPGSEPIAAAPVIEASAPPAPGQVVLVPIEPATAPAGPALAPQAEQWIAAEEPVAERAVWFDDDDDRFEHGRFEHDDDDDHDDDDHEHGEHGEDDDDD